MANVFKVLIYLALIVAGTADAGVRDDEVALVTVSKEVRADGVMFTYAVTNRGSRPIIGLSVGYDFYRGNVQLAGVWPTRLDAPPSWTATTVSLEQSDRFEMQWEIDQSGGGIQPGQSIALFRALVPADDAMYTNSQWTIIVDGPPLHASSRLSVVQGPGTGDTVAPTISVILSPDHAWPPNKQMVEVTALITVSDNIDAAPVVRLLSIVCADCADPANDISGALVGTDDRKFLLRADRTGSAKGGRICRVKYSATDASGNVGLAEATFTVPHDQRQ